MAVRYYISPIVPNTKVIETNRAKESTSQLRIDPEHYRTELEKKWPFAKIHDGGLTFPLRWSLDRENASGPEGGMLSDLQIVSLRRPDNDTLIEFVLWHRTMIPTEYTLYLFTDSDISQIQVIHPETTAEDIKRFLSSI